MKQLFKYMCQPWELFEKGLIRLSQPSVLNDPFEAAFCRKSLDKLADHFEEQYSWDPEFGQLSFSQYIDLRMHHVGVISFTENKENLLMWAHYANEHKGLVAGVASTTVSESIFQNLFRADALINSSFGEKYSKFDGIPKPVSYRKGLRYRNDMFDYDYSNISAEGADRVLHEVFLQKSDEWIYEQEHRVVLRLEQADCVIIPNINLINNPRVKDKIQSSKFCYLRSDDSWLIDLFELGEDAERMLLAIELAKLSKNPQVVYLMRLSPSAINNCLIGLNLNINKSDVLGKYACSVGYLDIWKAVRNVDYYSIEFKEL